LRKGFAAIAGNGRRPENFPETGGGRSVMGITAPIGLSAKPAITPKELNGAKEPRRNNTCNEILSAETQENCVCMSF
jgi:hypothetical protein